jgi:ferric iron reductase protein FhuF
MLALLTQKSMLELSPDNFHVEFHETGRAACFWIDLHEDQNAERLLRNVWSAGHAGPDPGGGGAGSDGEINGKLIWSNTGYLIHWYLTK